MPYLTPEEMPESDDCRSLFIPANSEWLAIVSGAISTLTMERNWQQFGAVTVEQAVDRMEAMLDAYYAGCAGGDCLTPDGYRIVRSNPVTGRIEEDVGGEWVEPQGEYAMPPTPARTEPTAEERRCLAAANAVNALSLLYESLADSWAISETEEQAIDAMMAVLIGIVGTAFALPVAALIAVYIALMAVVYATIEFVTADLWTEGFTEKLTCYFYECSSDDGGVVHFDIQCIYNKIASATTADFDLDEQLRLLLQISWLMMMIGTQALDAAGTATAVGSADCEYCGAWCYKFDFGADGLGAWTLNYGTLTSEGLVGALDGINYRVSLSLVLAEEVNRSTYTEDGFGVGAENVYLVNEDLSEVIWENFPPSDPHLHTNVIPAGTEIRFEAGRGSGNFTIPSITLGGIDAENPYGADNC